MSDEYGKRGAARVKLLEERIDAAIIQLRTDPQMWRVLAEVKDERVRQDAKWERRPGEWPAPDPDSAALAVLVEEVGEVARALLSETPDRVREELVQVAAVAVAWIEALDQAAKDEPDLPY